MSDITFVNIPSAVDHVHEWKTGIQKSMRGVEKLSAIRSWPLVGLSYDFNLTSHDERIYFRNALYLYSSKTKIWSLPLWADFSTLSTAAASGQGSIQCAATIGVMNYSAGRQAILVDTTTYLNYEVVTISTVSGNTIVATGNLTGTWDVATTFVCPLYDMILDGNSTDLRFEAGELSGVRLNFTEAFLGTRDFSYVAPPYTPSSYYGLDVFPADIISPQFSHSTEYFNNGTYAMDFGRGHATDYFDETEMIMSFNFLLGRRADHFKIRNFFDRQLGRYGLFWMPTFDRDLRPTASIASTDTVINIKSVDNYNNTFFSNDLTGRYVIFIYPDNSVYTRKITAASSSTITLGSATGKDWPTYDDIKISFLFLSRFNEDSLRHRVTPPAVGRISFKTKVIFGETIA